MSIEYVKQLSDAERRANARETIATAARRGESPHEHFGDEDLSWAYRGFENELASLELVAERARDERGRQISEKQTRDRLNRETRKVLVEWEIAEREERRAKAEVEAARRIAEMDV